MPKLVFVRLIQRSHLPQHPEIAYFFRLSCDSKDILLSSFWFSIWMKWKHLPRISCFLFFLLDKSEIFISHIENTFSFVYDSVLIKMISISFLRISSESIYELKSHINKLSQLVLKSHPKKLRSLIYHTNEV